MKKKSKRGDGRIVQKRCTRSNNIEWRDMWRAGYPPSLTLPIRSRFLSLPPRSSSFSLFPLLSLSSRPLLSSSPPLVRPVLPRASACTARHIHTDKMAYTVPVVQIAGNCSPRRGLSPPPPPPPRSSKGGKGRAEVSRACETANFMIYKRDPL